MDFVSLLVALNRQSAAELKIINAKVRELLAGHGVKAEREPGHCVQCGKTLIGQQRRSRKYCGDACRQQAHRSRKAPASPTVELRTITARQARPFVERWHYSKNVPGGKNVFFGWFANGRLYAVANYGIGVSMNHDTTLAKLTGEPVTRENLFELKRLCRVDPANPGMPLTKFLAGCHRILKREHGIRFVVSFSDPEHNRFAAQRDDVPYTSGGIYRAANFKHFGKTRVEWHAVEDDGTKRHRRFAYRHKEKHNEKKFAGWLKRKGWTRKPPHVAWPAGAMTMEAARKALGLKQQKTESKDRWFLRL